MTKRLILAVPALAAGLALSAPAQAQMGRDYDSNYGQPSGWRMTQSRNADIRQDINRLRQDIDRAWARRTISRAEATRLRDAAHDIQRLYASYARNGLNWREVNALETRVNRVRIALRMERRDWDGRRG